MPEVYQEISLNNHAIIEASAGTGKTYTIENLVLRILTETFEKSIVSKNPIDAVQIDQLLVVTYTEKAAGELQLRIRKSIEERLIQVQPNEEALKVHLQTSLALLNHAGISTIHGFCKKIINTYAFENNMPMGQEITDDSEGLKKHIHKQIRSEWKKKYGEFLYPILNLLKDSRGSDFLDTFSKISKELLGDNYKLKPEVQVNYKDVMNIEDYTEDIKRLSQSLLPKLQALEKLFNNEKKIPKNPSKYINKYSLSFQNFISNSEPLTLIDNKENFIKKLSTKATEKFSDDINALEEPYQLIFDKYQTLEGLKKNLVIRFLKDESICISELWKDEKQLAGYLSYDDMIRVVDHALCIKNSTLLPELQKTYRFGIIDEFQDTNPKQWSIFRNIFLKKNDNLPNRYLYIVGDPKQSIYSFQGADVNTYIHAKKILKEQFKAEEKTLNKNFRSTSNMIHAYNHLFKSIEDNWFFSNDINYNQVVQPGLQDNDSNCKYTINQHHKEHGETILNQPFILYDCPCGTIGFQRLKYASWCAAQIDILMNNCPVYYNKKPIHYGDIAILVQRKADAFPLISSFREYGIPFSFYKQEGVFQSEECLHFITLLRAIATPGYQDKNIISALLTVFFNSHPRDLLNIDRSKDTHHHFKLIDTWSELAQHQKWTELINSIFQDTSIQVTLALLTDGERRFANLNQISQYFLEYTHQNQGHLEDHLLHLEALFNEEISVSEDKSLYAKETESSRIQILTMHASKGLEFPVVFIFPKNEIQNNSKNFPIKHSLITNNEFINEIWISKELAPSLKSDLLLKEKQELMRLAYVAFTRAGFRTYAPIWKNNNTKEPSISKSPIAQALYNAYVNNDNLNNKSSFILVADNDITNHKRDNNEDSSGSDLTITKIQELIQEKKSSVKRINNFNQRKMIQTSYSSLVHGKSEMSHLDGRIDKNEEHDVDNPVDNLDNKTTPSFLYDALPSGASSGNVIHEVLEVMNFSEAPNLYKNIQSGDQSESYFGATEKLVEIIQSKLRNNNLGQPNKLKERTLSILRMIPQVLLSHVSDIPIYTLHKSNYKPEAEFHFTYDRQGKPFPEKKSDTAGYVIGFIDLLFRVQYKDTYRYHILDWKSNTLESYDKKSLDNSMIQSRYDQQAKLYTLALDKWLQQTLGNTYNPDVHLGMPYYVFVRGCDVQNENKSFGIWTPSDYDNWKPIKLRKEIKTIISSSTAIKHILEYKDR